MNNMTLKLIISVVYEMDCNARKKNSSLSTYFNNFIKYTKEYIQNHCCTFLYRVKLFEALNIKEKKKFRMTQKKTEKQ